MNRHNKNILVTLVDKEIRSKRKIKYNYDGKRTHKVKDIKLLNNEIFALTEIKKELLESDRGRD